MGQGRERQGSDFAPLKDSRGLGTWVLVATPSNRLGSLFMVTQVPLHHVVVPAAPAAVFSELDSCEGQAVVGQLQASCPQGDFAKSLLSRRHFPFMPQPSILGM